MLRKVCFVYVIAAVIILLANTASAKTGDVCGKIYSTDILALVNGVPINSYNIGGRTVIVAEDLFDGDNAASYGFYVEYNDELRVLTLNSYYFTPYYFENYGPPVKRGKVGTVLGDVYDTDIKVMCNGSEIKGYNIGGRTAICIEDMGTLDDRETSKFGYSKYLANFTWDETTRTVALNSIQPNLEEIDFRHGLFNFNYTYTDNVMTAQYDPSNYYYNTMSQTDGSAEFLDDYYTLKPFFINVNGIKYETGVCVRSEAWGHGITLFQINDAEKARALLIGSIPQKKTYDEALRYLYSHPDYTVTDRLDNDDYTVLTLLVRGSGGRVYFAVKKTGGYIKVDDYSDYSSDTSITITLTGNTVHFSVYPFGGPHGPVTMRTEYNLDAMEF